MERLALLVFALAVAVAVYATVERRGLHADGAHFLVRVLIWEDFFTPDASRRAAVTIMQSPLVLGAVLGLVDLDSAALVFCLSLELMPIGLLVLCYMALPRRRKYFFFFPLLHYLAGILSASAAPITEGPIATCYFWFLFYLILFRPLRTIQIGAVLLLSAPTVLMHEAMAGLAPILAIAALWRGRRTPDRARRVGFLLLAALFAVAVAVQIGFIIDPRVPAHRGLFLERLVKLWWLYQPGGAINMPALLGLIAVLVLSIIPLFRTRIAWATVWGFACLAAIAVVVAALFEHTIAPVQHFHARNNPAILSLFLAAGVLASLWSRRPHRLWVRPTSLAMCLVLAAAGFAWHAVEVRNWSIYVAAVRNAIAHGQGMVAREDVEAALSERDRQIFRNMSWVWAFPVLSIALAPQGRVSVMIDNERGMFKHFVDAHDPSPLLRSRYFDISPYRAWLESRKPAGAK